MPIVPSIRRQPFKVAEDLAVTLTPNAFLRLTQRAVADPSTEPMYASDMQLSQAFNQDFAAAQQAARRGNPVPLARIDAAARAAYRAIVAAWRPTRRPRTQLDAFRPTSRSGAPTTWTGRRAPNTSSYGNNDAAAGYWDAFVDGTGQALNGARHSYS